MGTRPRLTPSATRFDQEQVPGPRVPASKLRRQASTAHQPVREKRQARGQRRSAAGSLSFAVFSTPSVVRGAQIAKKCGSSPTAAAACATNIAPEPTVWKSIRKTVSESTEYAQIRSATMFRKLLIIRICTDRCECHRDNRPRLKGAHSQSNSNRKIEFIAGPRN